MIARLPLTKREAEKLGWIVDTHCYPWIGYREATGRFGQGDTIQIYTPRWPKKGRSRKAVQVAP